MSDLNSKKVTRRQVLKAVGAATVYAGAGNAFAQQPDKSQVTRKIKLGVIGCGGRGGWIAKLFKDHGGYEMYAVADYFQHVADKCGDELGVSADRRFSSLSGYKKLIDSGVEAVALETPRGVQKFAFHKLFSNIEIKSVRTNVIVCFILIC